MPAENRKPIKELLAKAGLLFGVASTDKKIGVPPEIDDDGYLRVALKTVADVFLNVIGNTLEVVRGKGGIVTSGILTEDTSVKAASGEVYWISACGDAVLYVEIVDDTADNVARERWGQFYPANNYSHYIFDPPIECDTGIFINITITGNAQVVVGYK